MASDSSRNSHGRTDQVRGCPPGPAVPAALVPWRHTAFLRQLDRHSWQYTYCIPPLRPENPPHGRCRQFLPPRPCVTPASAAHHHRSHMRGHLLALDVLRCLSQILRRELYTADEDGINGNVGDLCPALSPM